MGYPAHNLPKPEASFPVYSVVSMKYDDDDDGEEIRPISAETALLEARIRNIDTQVKLVGAVQRNMAGNYAGKVQGIMIGLVFTLVIGFLLLMAPLLGA